MNWLMRDNFFTEGLVKSIKRLVLSVKEILASKYR